jgi:hypothetical protein
MKPRSANTPGRPRVKPGALTVPLTVRLSADDYDRHYALAREARLSLPDWIRRSLRTVAVLNTRR